jgi:putative tryptophan/tyrosine transport system substrate-binding protein
MRRRQFIVMLGGLAVAWPDLSQAQGRTRIARVGFLGLGAASAWADQTEAFRAGLRDLGYVEGKTIAIEYRWAPGVEQLPAAAAELVSMNVDVIVAPASTEVEPARRETKTIPIVFAQHADPIGLGHVASLAHPGGNITGMSMVLTEIAVKALDIFREFAPQARRIGVLWNPTTPSHTQVLKALAGAAKKMEVELLLEPVRTAADFDGAFAAMRRERADGFVVPSSPVTNSAREILAELELRYRLPGIFVNKENVAAGGLMSYGADFNYMYRRAAFFVDKILKGEKPADIPVEQASKYALVINLKTARAIGIDIPESLLARADEVIE